MSFLLQTQASYSWTQGVWHRLPFTDRLGRPQKRACRYDFKMDFCNIETSFSTSPSILATNTGEIGNCNIQRHTFNFHLNNANPCITLWSIVNGHLHWCLWWTRARCQFYSSPKYLSLRGRKRWKLKAGSQCVQRRTRDLASGTEEPMNTGITWVHEQGCMLCRLARQSCLPRSSLYKVLRNEYNERLAWSQFVEFVRAIHYYCRSIFSLFCFPCS